ncbi:hypothetical protein AAAC51_38145 [Priestia megaterium]
MKSFSTLQSLRKLGVSIEELKEYLSSQNTHKFVQMANQQTVIVEKKLKNCFKFNVSLSRLFQRKRN